MGPINKRDEQVRITVAAQVYKHLGTRPQDVTPDVRNFVDQAVMGLVKSHQLAAGDVARVAQLTRPLLPDAGPKSPQPPKQEKLVSPRLRQITVPPTETPPLHPLVPLSPTDDSEHRRTVEDLYHRMERDREWADQVVVDKKKYEEEQKKMKQNRRDQQRRQEEILRKQMQEVDERRRREKHSRQRDMQDFLETQRQKEEEDRKKEAQLKEQSKRTRLEMESYMKERISERQQLLREQKEKDRQYIEEIIAQEKEKKELERQRKKMSREELLMFLSGNVESQKARKEIQEQQNERERKDIEERAKLMAKQEAEADAERKRKDVKGKRLMDRAERVQREYDAREGQRMKKVRAHEQREVAELEAKALAERGAEIDRLMRKQELKSTLVTDLEKQIEDKRRREKEQHEAESRYKEKVEEALTFGSTSELILKKKIADQQELTRKVLEEQMREKRRRSCLDPQVKI